MPIVLLPTLIDAIVAFGAKLSPWTRLVSVEEQLLRRARSAFLVHWFGTALPSAGISLRVMIVNIDALRARKRLVDELYRSRYEPTVSLLEPLATMGGALVGILLSPTTMIAIMGANLEQLPWWVGALGLLAVGALIALIAWQPGISGALVGLGALVGPAFLAFGNGRSFRPIYQLLGAVAELLVSASRFLDVLMGPRSEVRNPLLRWILETADRFAQVVPYLYALFAVLITRVVPLIEPLIAEYQAFRGLIEAAWDVVTHLFETMLDRLEALWSGPRSIFYILEMVVGYLTLALTEAQDIFLVMFDQISTELTIRWEAFVSGARTAFETTFRTFVAQVEGLPIWRLFEGLYNIVTRVIAVAGTLDWTPEDEEGGFVSGLMDFFEWVYGPILETPDFPDLDVPDFPALPGLPDFDAILSAAGGMPRPTFLDLPTTVPTIDREPIRVALGLDRPMDGERPELRSVFAAEWARLRRQLGRSPSDELQRIQDGQGVLRQLIYAAVGRAAPSSLRLESGRVQQIFRMIDRQLFLDSRSEATPAPRTPLRLQRLQVQSNLRVQVRTFQVRSRGGFRPDVAAFQTAVAEAVRGQTYDALPAGA